MEYKILMQHSWKDLEDAVNIQLRDGWKPQGGVSIAPSEEGGYKHIVYAQALILEKK